MCDNENKTVLLMLVPIHSIAELFRAYFVVHLPLFFFSLEGDSKTFFCDLQNATGKVEQLVPFVTCKTTPL